MNNFLSKVHCYLISQILQLFLTIEVFSDFFFFFCSCAFLCNICNIIRTEITNSRKYGPSMIKSIWKLLNSKVTGRESQASTKRDTQKRLHGTTMLRTVNINLTNRCTKRSREEIMGLVHNQFGIGRSISCSVCPLRGLTKRRKMKFFSLRPTKFLLKQSTFFCCNMTRNEIRKSYGTDKFSKLQFKIAALI